MGVVLLAAGRSQRFGSRDKLVQDFRGQALASHAAERLAALPFAIHLAVIGPGSSIPLPPVFRTVANPDPSRGLSSSIALGIRALAPHDLDGCLIALADMPLVPTAHFVALLDGFAASGGEIIATANGGRAQVPAVFGSAHFAALATLSGDSGARDLLRQARTVVCAEGLLADFDLPRDFTRYAR